MSIDDDIFDLNPPFNPSISFTRSGERNNPLYKPTPPKKRPTPQPKVNTNSPLMKTIMKAKELDTKISMLKQQGKRPRDYVDLLDEFHSNSQRIEIESTTPTKGSKDDKPI